MKWHRLIAPTHVLTVLALSFAMVPAWLGVVTYKDALLKDERVYDTTAQVLAEKLQTNFERHTYLPRELRAQARSLDDAALGKGGMMPNFPWQEKLPHLLALGYAVQNDSGLILKWKSTERSPVAAIGEDLSRIPGVIESLKGIPANDPFTTTGCTLEHEQYLVLLAIPDKDSVAITRGYVVAWIDLASLCRDPALTLIRDQVLTATPLAEKEKSPANSKRSTISDRNAHWEVGIRRGPGFSLQYGPPTPWLTFAAVGLSAVPLLVLASLAGRSAKLSASLNAERELVRQQRFFTQSVSHEFRTPLGIILSGADLLESYWEKLSSERRSEVLNEIKFNTQHMNELIECVLLLGRMESNKLSRDLQWINVSTLCQEVAGKVSTASHERCPIIIHAPNQEVMLDAFLLGSILDNLLSNAVKYSSSGSPVHLDGVLGKDKLVITVIDKGIGIPAKDLARVCDPFHRSSNVGLVAGTGLGLAIAQRCATLHQGTLSLTSEEGVGTKATVTLSLT